MSLLPPLPYTLGQVRDDSRYVFGIQVAVDQFILNWLHLFIHRISSKLKFFVHWKHIEEGMSASTFIWERNAKH